MTEYKLPPEAHIDPIVLGLNEPTFDTLARLTPKFTHAFRVPSRSKHFQYVLMDPAEIRHVMVSNHAAYEKGRSFRNMKLLLGDALIVQDGALWRRQRKMLQPLFHQTVLGRLARVMEERAKATLLSWTRAAQAGHPVDVTDEISRATLDTLLEAIFGEDLSSLETSAGRTPFHILAEHPSRDVQFVPKFRQTLEHVLRVAEHRLRAGRMPPDLLSMMMLARDASGQPMSPSQLCDEVAMLLVAGHETTAATLAWIWFLVATHPVTQDKFHTEVDRYAPLDRSFAESSFLKRVIFEALRLYPPLWLYERVAAKDDVIGDYDVPAGTSIFVPIYFIQREERFFEDAPSFKPERFESFNVDRRYRDRNESSSEIEAKNRGSAADERAFVTPSDFYTFVPFGTGPRRCIGDHFALMNAQIHLATIGKSLQFRHFGPPKLEFEARVNLRPKQNIELQPELRIKES